MKCKFVHLCGLLCGSVVSVAAARAQNPAPADLDSVGPTNLVGVKRVFLDVEGDAVARRTSNGLGVTPPASVGLPDLAYATLGAWAPVNTGTDPYLGLYSAAGGFFRLDLVFAGLVNPPGHITTPYTPAEYGPAPVFVRLELDLDANENTGGDTVQPEDGYNANVARFGGVPAGTRFNGRISTDGLPWSGAVTAVPAIHRSGEEFEFRLQGEFVTDIVADDVNSNGLFDAGETWVLGGYFLRRARAYDDLTYADGYEPWVTVRFKHSPGRGITVVTLVYPLTNAGHAWLYQEPPEANDFWDYNANSVLEALNDLQLSAAYPPADTANHAFRVLLAPWAAQTPEEYLNPWDWRCTILSGTVLVNAPTAGGVFVWSDVWPNVVSGDFNGDSLVSRTDGDLLGAYVVLRDGDPLYDTGSGGDAQVVLVGFASRFSVFDRDYDATVSEGDDGVPVQGPCDYDNDGDVDLADAAAVQFCFAEEAASSIGSPSVGCLDAFDLDDNANIVLEDFALCTFSGPANGGPP